MAEEKIGAWCHDTWDPYLSYFLQYHQGSSKEKQSDVRLNDVKIGELTEKRKRLAEMSAQVLGTLQPSSTDILKSCSSDCSMSTSV